jgi:PKD repeat protein
MHSGRRYRARMGRALTRRVLLAAVAVVAVLGVAAGVAERGQAAPGAIQLVSIGTFVAPTYVTAPPGDTARVFVVEKRGTVEVLHDGVVSKFLDIQSRVTESGTEQGLLSIAFDPNYATNGLLYADYTTKSPSGDLEIDEFHATGNAVDSGPRLVLLIPHIAAQNHNGGQLQFGPDGDLYIGTGDGGDEDDTQGNGQNPASLLAKILRIDPHQNGASPYTVPADNPAPSGQRPGWAPEVYAMGLRNPWRFSFDAPTGRLVIADVGQDMYEEVDDLSVAGASGANFGWSCYEAMHPGPKTGTGCLAAGTTPTPPVFEYDHSGGRCSITGGVVVHDFYLPALAGRYVYGDYCSGGLYSFAPPTTDGAAATDNSALGLNVPQLSSFGVDGAGHVYAASLTGTVYRLFQSGVADAPPVPSFTVTPNPATPGQTVRFDASGSSDPDGHIVTYAWDLTGDGKTDASGPTASTTYTTTGTHSITLTVTDDGGVSASKTISLVVRAAGTGSGGSGGSGGGSNGSNGGNGGGSNGTAKGAAHLAGTTVHVTTTHRIASVLRSGLPVNVKSTAPAHWAVSLIVDPATAKRLHIHVAKGVRLISIGTALRPKLRSGTLTIAVHVRASVRAALSRLATVHLRVRAVAFGSAHRTATTWHALVFHR